MPLSDSDFKIKLDTCANCNKLLQPDSVSAFCSNNCFNQFWYPAEPSLRETFATIFGARKGGCE